MRSLAAADIPTGWPAVAAPGNVGGRDDRRHRVEAGDLRGGRVRGLPRSQTANALPWSSRATSGSSNGTRRRRPRGALSGGTSSNAAPARRRAAKTASRLVDSPMNAAIASPPAPGGDRLARWPKAAVAPVRGNGAVNGPRPERTADWTCWPVPNASQIAEVVPASSRANSGWSRVRRPRACAWLVPTGRSRTASCGRCRRRGTEAGQAESSHIAVTRPSGARCGCRCCTGSCLGFGSRASEGSRTRRAGGLDRGLDVIAAALGRPTRPERSDVPGGVHGHPAPDRKACPCWRPRPSAALPNGWPADGRTAAATRSAERSGRRQATTAAPLSPTASAG